MNLSDIIYTVQVVFYSTSYKPSDPLSELTTATEISICTKGRKNIAKL